jgi:hypothetical protein
VLSGVTSAIGDCHSKSFVEVNFVVPLQQAVEFETSLRGVRLLLKLRSKLSLSRFVSVTIFYLT